MTEYVTKEECARRREVKDHDDVERDKKLTEHTANISFLAKGFWTIFATLVAGFASVIFAVLSLGR